jgi:hypothetical protein
MTMPGDTEFNTGLSFWGTNLTLAVINGTVPEWRLDDMCMRIMAAFFKVGQVVGQDGPNFSSWTSDTFGPLHASVGLGHQLLNQHIDVRHDHGSLIRDIAAKGTVLLKNTGSLPLKKPKLLAVIGEDAGPNLGGPNGCPNRGCDNGTLAAAWGSGTAEFPYLVTPDTALQLRALQDGTRYESILDNYQTSQIKSLVSQANATAIVFVNANAGEGFINVDGNEGDRKNLTLWKDGDALIKNVSSWCPNTIVVIHSVGPTILTDWYDSPNVTAILWAGLPGQESGNSIADVLYGRINPAARSPFTWGRTRESYGVDVMYEPNGPIPQQDFSEGVFIDYRHFDRTNQTPIYEFGHGLSYTTFSYSNLQVQKTSAGSYTPTTGQTAVAPTFGNSTISKNLNDYVFPNASFPHIWQFIYPYLNTSSSGKEASGDPQYGQAADQFLPPGANDGSAQPLLPAAGKSRPGGNAQLYDVMYTVTATITNTGSLVGDEVPQLYVSLGGPNDPPVMLRDFDRIRVDAGASATFRGTLTRRDLSEWDTARQNWVVSSYPKKVFVGPSSRKLPLSADLS